MSGTAVAASANTDGKGAPVNTLCPGMTRLPLGKEAEDKSPVGAKSYFSLYIPTDAGGTLRVFHKGGGTLELIVPDGKVVLAKSDPRRTDELTFEVAPGRFGTFIVVAEGGRDRRVSCSFEQVGFARESAARNAPPLIPWNFYYWPSCEKWLKRETKLVDGEWKTEETFKVNPNYQVMLDVLRKYARATGKNPATIVEWEKKFHGKPVGPKWVGHCHFGAGASILFEEPKPITVNNESFTEEELEYLAAEWFGNYGVKVNPKENKKLGWVLEAGNAPMDKVDWLFLPMMFKPNESKDVRHLEFALRSYNPIPGMNHKSIARDIFSMDKDLDSKIVGYFGELAASFYQFLLDKMLGEGHPFAADLRSEDASSGPAEVWNHAVFMFRATLVEHDAPSDDRDIEVTCDLFANDDFLDPNTRTSTGLPAEVLKNGEVLPGGSSGSLDHRVSRQKLRLIYDGRGKVVQRDSRNTWILSTKPGTSLALYAPAFLLPLEKANLDPKAKKNQPDKDALEIGNVYVDQDLVTGATAMLRVRKRYL